MKITLEQLSDFREKGYFILERAMTEAHLEGLRAECQRYVDKFEREMEAKGVTSQGINHYKTRYFISNRGNESSIITDFLFSELMAEITRATLGENSYLFNEQYVVKAAEKAPSSPGIRIPATSVTITVPISPAGVRLMICRWKMARSMSSRMQKQG